MYYKKYSKIFIEEKILEIIKFIYINRMIISEKMLKLKKLLTFYLINDTIFSVQEEAIHFSP